MRQNLMAAGKLLPAETLHWAKPSRRQFLELNHIIFAIVVYPPRSICAPRPLSRVGERLADLAVCQPASALQLKPCAVAWALSRSHACGACASLARRARLFASRRKSFLCDDQHQLSSSVLPVSDSTMSAVMNSAYYSTSPSMLFVRISGFSIRNSDGVFVVSGQLAVLGLNRPAIRQDLTV